MDSWWFFLIFFGSSIALNLFMRYILPQIRSKIIGNRLAWASQHGFLDEPDPDSFLKAIDYPGCLSYPDLQAKRVLRREKTALVDCFVLIKHGSMASKSWMEPRLMTVLVSRSGANRGLMQITPRNFRARLLELVFSPSQKTADPAFDRHFQVVIGGLENLMGQVLRKRLGFGNRSPFEKSAEKEAELSPLLRSVFQQFPQFTFEFDRNFLLIYQKWKLIPDRRLEALISAGQEVLAALGP